MPAPSSPGLVTGVDHYENFPVASVLVPRRLRPAVLAIYRFARYADDVADEGDQTATQRLAELEGLRRALLDPSAPRHPMVDPLLPYLAAHDLPREACAALLSAFAQDVTVTRYPDDAALLDYCARSANPVGRLVLGLFGCRNPQNDARSDAICSALQLINFLQDAAIDWSRGRLYLPLDSLRAHGIDESAVAEASAGRRAGPALRACIAGRVRHAAALLESGAPLLRHVPGRLSLELRATVAGGRRILERLASGGNDPFASRPTIGWRDAPALARLMFSPPRLR